MENFKNPEKIMYEKTKPVFLLSLESFIRILFFSSYVSNTDIKNFLWFGAHFLCKFLNHNIHVL